MGKLVIDRGNFTDLTSVSNLFIDEYMPNANGEFVKIYLYLLRLVSGHSTEITTDALADLLCFTESDDEDRSDESSDFLFHLCYMYESNGISTAAYP